jgi:hypothetical protein
MHEPCLRNILHASRLYRLLTLGGLAVLTALAWPSAIASAQSADKKPISPFGRNSASPSC